MLIQSFLICYLPLSTSLAHLGSGAYPIFSHIILVLTSSSPPPCHIALLLLLSPEHSILPLLTDDPVTFYDILWYSRSHTILSSTFYAFPLLTDTSCTFYHVLLPSLLDLLTGSVYPCDPITYSLLLLQRLVYKPCSSVVKVPRDLGSK